MDRANIDDLLQHAFRYAMALTHDHDQAHEIVQEASIAIVRNGSPWTREYLFRVVKHRFLDGLRRSKRRLGQSVLTVESLAIRDDRPTSNTCEHLEDYSILSAHLSRLRPEEREVLYLSIVQGMSASQIAHLLECPRGTVLSLLQRSRAKLSDSLTSTEGTQTYGNLTN